MCQAKKHRLEVKKTKCTSVKLVRTEKLPKKISQYIYNKFWLGKLLSRVAEDGKDTHGDLIKRKWVFIMIL